ncbi:hypothetical protein [Streptomyces sp. NPDC056194]|uniref:hypothetical protein n=1 Tax=unclassified Streptomyces TaxID=2593676 RepID=UPI0035E1341D
MHRRSRPSVSAPVAWEKVEGCASPEDLALLMGDIAPRLERHGDLMEPLFEPGRAGAVP